MDKSESAPIAKDFLNTNKGETDAEKDDHIAIPPTGMLSVDGTKIETSCAICLHRFKDVLYFPEKVDIHQKPPNPRESAVGKRAYAL